MINPPTPPVPSNWSSCSKKGCRSSGPPGLNCFIIPIMNHHSFTFTYPSKPSTKSHQDQRRHTKLIPVPHSDIPYPILKSAIPHFTSIIRHPTSSLIQLILGLITREYTTTRLITTKIVAMNRYAWMTMYHAGCGHMHPFAHPGQAKMVSVRRAPPSRMPN